MGIKKKSLKDFGESVRRNLKAHTAMVRFFTVTSLLLAKTAGATAREKMLYIENAGVKICQIAAISPEKAVTASHCLSNLSIPQDYKVFADSESHEVKHIERQPNDIAILTINGQFVQHSIAGKAIPGKPIEAAFSSSKGQKSLGKILSLTEDGFAEHDLKTKKGDSGTPIFQEGKLIGVHVGTMKKEGHGLIALLEAEGKQPPRLAYNEEVPPLVAAAITWCTANPQVCGSMIGASATITVAAIGGTITYLVSLNNVDKAVIQKQLEVCTAEKDAIIEQLVKESAAQKGRGGLGGSFESQAPSDGSSIIPDDVTIIDTRIPPSGQTRCFWDGPSLRCLYSPEAIGTAARELLFLARIAFLHKFHSVEKRWPTAAEIARLKGELLSESLDTMVWRAKNGLGISIQPPLCYGPGCVEP